MLPSHWGPSAWKYLHTVTFNYPLKPNEIDKKRYTNFFDSIILPCTICDESFNLLKSLFEIDDYLEDRNGLVYWLYWLHILVDIKLGKTVLPKFSDIVLYYEEMRVDCKITVIKNKKQCEKEENKENKENKELYIDFVNATINKYDIMTRKKILNIIEDIEYGENEIVKTIKQNIKASKE